MLDRSPEFLVQTDLVLDAAVNALVEKFSPRRIVLFGSRARGDANESSDYDFMVEVDRDRDTRGIYNELWSAVRGAINAEFNLAIRTAGSFESKRDDPGFIDWDISREGVLLYERESYGSLTSGVTVVSEPAGGWPSVRTWLAYAEKDCAVVELLLNSGGSFWAATTFHSHECIEKFLKAYWVKLGVRAKKTHSLRELSSPLPHNIRDVTTVCDAISLLDKLYWRSRYPPDDDEGPNADLMDVDPAWIPSEEEARLAAEGARTLRALVSPLVDAP
jgi:uncharacterized protein